MSTQMTFAPQLLIRWYVNAEPINPAPPVTIMVIQVSPESVIWLRYSFRLHDYDQKKQTVQGCCSERKRCIHFSALAPVSGMILLANIHHLIKPDNLLIYISFSDLAIKTKPLERECGIDKKRAAYLSEYCPGYELLNLLFRRHQTPSLGAAPGLFELELSASCRASHFGKISN